MADSKKYNGSTWEHSLRKLATATDTFTTLPVDVYADGNNATVGLKGNTVQNGTPTPDSPITPQGTGERTGNVMPAGEQKTVVSNGVTFSSDGNGRYHISGTATEYTTAQFNLLSPFTIPISVGNGGQGTLSFFNTQSNSRVSFVFNNGTTIVDSWAQTPIRRTNDAYNTLGNKYVDNVVIAVGSGATVDITITPEFTNNGIIPSEFEPYGYKIPISSANTTTPVYLGEVETTRKIKKYECTGDESWTVTSEQGKTRAVANFTTSIGIVPLSKVVSTHYIGVEGGAGYPAINTITVNINGTMIIGISSEYTDANAFKAYLQQQYAAGTPVTIWYVLAEPETAVVNEPLMKIGDYADTVSGITIPTITGKDTFDVETTIKPSEVSLNYTGWHDSSVKEWDGSEWQ